MNSKSKRESSESGSPTLRWALMVCWYLLWGLGAAAGTAVTLGHWAVPWPPWSLLMLFPLGYLVVVLVVALVVAQFCTSKAFAARVEATAEAFGKQADDGDGVSGAWSGEGATYSDIDVTMALSF